MGDPFYLDSIALSRLDLMFYIRVLKEKIYRNLQYNYENMKCKDRSSRKINAKRGIYQELVLWKGQFLACAFIEQKGVIHFVQSANSPPLKPFPFFFIK